MSAIDLRIEEARDLLRSFGFDKGRCNERAARVLLAMLGMTPESPWSAVRQDALPTFEIMERIRQHWGMDYKPNTRETIRRQTLHQFIQAGFAVLNADDPARPVNSKDNNYRISDEALDVIRIYGTDGFVLALTEYLVKQPGLVEMFAAARNMERIPVTLPDGTPLTLSPGGQNPLIAAMITDFCAQYVPGGEVLYVGDADAKLAHFAEARLAELGVTVDHHGKLPDLVVYQPSKDWLFLMEAASTHGPVDAKRHHELAALFADCTAGLVYVSCFPDRATMRRFLADLAWETEVWLADDPSHMIHLNGERFLGPYE
ncbi:BsuBI/PstI family type II restriction endonuclease [Gordonia sp. (in: high G+C Gram-positive bacteria)]|uniref:BsuBI/PstI family type II restriction endonuclease n=1 Tax=Gordonia sp. (in: high G+C Gram-positive bacteria) TaxID=84139 RepID=UPI003528F46F